MKGVIKMRKVFFVGGPGNISSSTALDLLNRGYSLGIFTLTGRHDDEGIKDKVKMYYGDRNNTESLREAFESFRPDIVIDFTCFTPEQAQSMLDLAFGKVEQFIFISTCDVYGFPLSKIPMTENDSFNPPNCRYAADKRKCEELLWQRYESSGFPLTVVRTSYSMGKRFVITALSRAGGRYLIPRLRAGMPVLVPGDGTTLTHPSAAYDTGRMIARMVDSEISIGKSYTCGSETYMTHDEYIHLFANALGVQPNIVHIPSDLILNIECDGIKPTLLEELTRYNVAFSMENFKVDFPDFKWEKPLIQAAREYIEWNDKMGNFPDPSEEIYEDRIIRLYQERVKDFKLSSEGIHFIP
jgi:nucleoside-diphosphate-sugar epimerase